jgi:hypothetical protein
MTRTAQSGNRFTQPVKQSTNKKERPICSHYEISRHTVDKCYKVHGYSSGFKFTKDKVAPHSKYCSRTVVEEFSPSSQQFPPQMSTQQLPKLPITSEQCQQLMSMVKYYPTMSSCVMSPAFANTIGSVHN